MLPLTGRARWLRGRACCHPAVLQHRQRRGHEGSASQSQWASQQPWSLSSTMWWRSITTSGCLPWSLPAARTGKAPAATPALTGAQAWTR